MEKTLNSENRELYVRRFLTPATVPTDDPILAAIFRVESQYDPFAMRFEPEYQWVYNAPFFAKQCGITLQTEITLQKFSYGLGQIMGGTARWLGYRGPLPGLLDVETNVHWCSVYWNNLLQKYNGDTWKAVSAYNQGSAAGCDTGKCKNQQYVDKVKAESGFFAKNSRWRSSV
jgi:hypothetical protein